jgi:hypothetical protein
VEPFADKYSYYVPRFLPLPLAKAKNGDQQFWKEKFHAANEEAQLALMNGPGFSFLKGGGGDGFFVFSLVPNLSPSGSQSVLKCVPQDVPNSTWVLFHMVCSKFNSLVYKVKR